MSIVAWIFFGIMIGILVNFIDPEPAYGGILGAIFLALTGAFLGGVISSIFIRSGILTGLNLTTLVIALGGSLIVLMIGRSIRKT
jgi:uncharacterized membrane protein YeaQ/YmgE (transglycosylase-associated protein family)